MQFGLGASTFLPELSLLRPRCRSHAALASVALAHATQGETSSSTRPLVSSANRPVMIAATAATTPNARNTRGTSETCAGEARADHQPDHVRPDHRGKPQPGGCRSHAEGAHP